MKELDESTLPGRNVTPCPLTLALSLMKRGIKSKPGNNKP
jgi:hypothetical protein